MSPKTSLTLIRDAAKRNGWEVTTTDPTNLRLHLPVPMIARRDEHEVYVQFDLVGEVVNAYFGPAYRSRAISAARPKQVAVAIIAHLVNTRYRPSRPAGGN